MIHRNIRVDFSNGRSASIPAVCRIIKACAHGSLRFFGGSLRKFPPKKRKLPKAAGPFLR
jgi:hypothetical protein